MDFGEKNLGLQIDYFSRAPFFNYAVQSFTVSLFEKGHLLKFSAKVGNAECKNICFNINIELNGTPLERDEEFKYLGVNIDQTLSFDNHIKYMCGSKEPLVN